jgi:hypothetical protein
MSYDINGELISDTDDRTVEEVRTEMLAAIREDAARRIEANWPQWKQLNTIRAGGDKLAQMGKEIDAIRAASNVAQAAAVAAKSLAELYAVSGDA